MIIVIDYLKEYDGIVLVSKSGDQLRKCCMIPVKICNGGKFQININS